MGVVFKAILGLWVISFLRSVLLSYRILREHIAELAKANVDWMSSRNTWFFCLRPKFCDLRFFVPACISYVGNKKISPLDSVSSNYIIIV